MTCSSIRTAWSGTRISASSSSPSSIRRRSSSPNIRSRSSSRARRSEISRLNSTSDGTLWFDTMFQGSLGNLDPKTGEIKYYPLGAEYNDNRVQLNFVGLRHDIDGKVWTKSVGTQDIFRARSGEREMGALPAAQAAEQAGRALDLSGHLRLQEQSLDGRVHGRPSRQDRRQDRRGHLVPAAHAPMAGRGA